MSGSGRAGDLALDDNGAQRALDVIIRGRDIGAVQKRPHRSPEFEKLRAGAC